MIDKDIGSEDYRDFGQFLERQCGIVLGDNKQYLVRSRLVPLLRKFDFESLTELTKKVASGSDHVLRDAVIDAMTTNETLWFRDTYPFELLKNDVLPRFADSRSPVNIWSAACSSGQEPYSIGMTVLEYKNANPRALPGGVRILGTDISTDMLRTSAAAEYDNLSLSRGLPEQKKQMFFEPGENGAMRVKSNVRNMVSFKQMNLLDGYSSLGRFEIVFCRNVLIYFSPEVKRKILQQIAAGLQKDGILFLGASESMTGISDQFTMVRCGSGLYYVKK